MSRFGFTIVLLACVALTTSCLVTNTTRGEDWPQFRGPSGNASSADSTPTQWSDTKNLIWKTKIPGRGSSSPIVIGDKIFLTSYTGYGMHDDDPGEKTELRLNTLCFERTSGKMIWNKSIEASANEQEFARRLPDHGYASGTPTSDGKAIYAFFGVSGAVAFDLNGKQLWHNDELGTSTTGFGSASSPVVHQDLVYINASIECKTLFALDKKTGKVVWKKEDIDRSWSSPCLAANKNGVTELIINQKFKVLGLDPKTGKELWTCDGIEDYVVPVPVAKNGIIYCLGGRGNKAMAIQLGGQGDVTDTHRLWIINIGANVTSPVLHQGHLYWASDKGIANCINASNGETIYRERMPTKARVYASIIRAGDHLYLPTRDNGVWVLPAKPDFKAIALNKIESDKTLFNASPAVSHHQLLIRSDKFLYCIGESE
ncbi:MAG: PQQ-binding-like beta-propeller repeat protein [Mariniblastus sp.]|nr:PQQ-binding-like beta-propeller repeat protein [Mariniblastus sp.]